jgi:mannose/fructose/N-acetylgalactosamine-specific phosphotransferase system component IIC
MKKDDIKIAGFLIPGGLLIGIGVGMVLNQVAAGTLIGLGAGFVAAFHSCSKEEVISIHFKVIDRYLYMMVFLY